MPNIHPTAIVDPDAELAEDVRVGPNSIVEADVRIGPGCILREGVIVRRCTEMGQGNLVDAGVVLGGLPQDLKFDPATTSYLRIGDRNVFREGVTISRGSRPGSATVVGNDCYWMAYSHAGHDATVGDRVILANGALIAGHATIGSRVFLSANVLVHQFTWVGQSVMARGGGGASMHVPPYTIFARENCLVGLNVVGMRRDETITSEDRRQVKEAFRLVYRAGLALTEAIEQMDHCGDWGGPAGEFRDFVRKAAAAEPPYNRGLMTLRRRD